MIFRMGIIKGEIKDGSINIITENKSISNEVAIEISNDIDKIKNFLTEHDYIYNIKSSNITFSKRLIKNNLREYLIKNNISQSDLAKQLGLGRTSVNNLCNASNIELETLYKLSTVLRIKPEDTIRKIFPPDNMYLFEPDDDK